MISAIYRKREEEEKFKAAKTFNDLFPESASAEKTGRSFSIYRDPRNSFGVDDVEADAAEKFRGRSRPRARKEFDFEHRDPAFAQIVDAQISRLEQERRLKVERTFLERKDRMNRLAEKLRSGSVFTAVGPMFELPGFGSLAAPAFSCVSWVAVPAMT